MVENNKQPVSTKSILDVAEENLTPGMKQYRDIKKANPDCLIMLRMGDFFEMFYEDAVTAAKALEITLTARGQGEKRAPLAGVPYHALETYLGRLVKKGYKVAIVEQLEDPKKAKGLVKRGLVRIVTPGTVIESSMLEENENNYILALTSYGDEFAIAYSDLSTGEFITTSVQNVSSLMAEISRLNPSECLIPESLKVNVELINQIKNSGSFINSLEDYYFKPEKAREILLDHFNLQSLDSFGLEEKKLNLSVSGALIKYLLDTQKNSLSHIKKVTFSDRNRMIIDSSTLRNLELVKNLRDSTTRGTLLSILEKTITAMGSRLLKKWIKEPLINKKVIKKRLSAVEELYKNIIVREDLVDLLKEVYDLERLISRVNYGNANPRDLLSLKQSLQKIPLIKEKLTEFNSELLTEIANISGLEDVAELIDNSVREDAPLLVREGRIIKPS